MKAWLLDRISSVKDLHLADIAEPLAGAGEIVIRMAYAALNPADAYLAEGQYPAKPTFPHILGRDGIGTITSLGDGVKGFVPGQKVVLLRSDVGVNRAGTLAEKVAVPADSLAAVPAGWTDQEAAGATLVYLTAYQALTQWELAPGGNPGHRGARNPQVILVTGASGGVGVASVQLAKALGHTVIGLSRSAEKAQKVLELGADAVFDPADKLWPKKLREYLNPSVASGDPKTARKAAAGGRRVDLAIDSIGGTLLPEVIETLGMNGKVSVVGRLAGPVPNFNTATLFFRRIRLGGVAIGTYTNAETHAAWQAAVALLAKSNAKPLVDQVFEFAEVQGAFARLAAGPMGKVLVRVGG
ncbi:MAG: zinc-binding alcohol dehydrogenase family protein [Phycisphaerae bacterium]